MHVERLAHGPTAVTAPGGAAAHPAVGALHAVAHRAQRVLWGRGWVALTAAEAGALPAGRLFHAADDPSVPGSVMLGTPCRATSGRRLNGRAPRCPAAGSAYRGGMAGHARRCGHCDKPLRAAARADAVYCGPACRAAAARFRRHYEEAVRIGCALVSGDKASVSRRCPVCGHWFIPGHGHRRDAVYDEPACRTAAWRARRRAADPRREAVTGQSAVTDPGTATRA